MNQTNPLQAYKETSIKTASSGKLIVMLYDAAIRQLTTAVELLKENGKELDKVNNCLLRAQDIVTELMASLDFERGGEIAKNLFSLYMFFNQQLINANIRKEPEPMEQILNMLSELRGSWVTIAGKTPGELKNADAAQEGGGVNIAG
ncbi:MAG: flagellar export chaperone FliS [Spirochaetales bacterium]|nr:MAG: flagellar export chaperone FliS [Spirochaetales bacterium]